MNAAILLDHYARIADAADAIVRLRRFVLDLAVRGKLVEQDSEREYIDGLDGPFAIPSDWCWRRIGDELELLNGMAFKPTDWVLAGLPIVRIQNLNNPLAQFNFCDPTKARDRSRIDDGAFLISWSGTPGTSFGAFIWQRGEAVLNQHIFRCDFKTKNFVPDFLRLAINGRLDEMIAKAHGGVGLQHITKGKLEAMLIALPPLAEQHRIVAKVDELMALCDQLEAARAEREAARDTFTLSTLAKLNTPDPETFGQDARFALANLAPLTTRPDQIKHLRQTILNLAVCGRLVESETSMRQSVLGQVGKFVGGSGFPKQFQGKQDMEIPFLKVSDMNLPGNERLISTANNHVSRDDLRAMRAKAHPAGTIIFPKIGGAIATNKRRILGCPAAIDNNCAGQVPNDDINVDWLYFVLSSVDMAAYQAGTAVPALNMKQLAEHPVAIPPKSEQYRIVAKVAELMALCDQLEASLIAGEQTRSRLLEVVLHNALEPA